MPSKSLLELSAVTTIEDADRYYVVRGAGDFYITGASLLAAIPQTETGWAEPEQGGNPGSELLDYVAPIDNQWLGDQMISVDELNRIAAQVVLLTEVIQALILTLSRKKFPEFSI